MRHLAAGILCLAVFTAQATTVDYTVALDPNGFNIFEVTKDNVTKVPGSPFGSNYVKYVGTDGTYVYAVTMVLSPIPIGPYETSEVVTYAMKNGIFQKTAVLADPVYQGGCGHCFSDATDMVFTPQHLFVKTVAEQQGIDTSVRLYHRHSGGTLTVMCNIDFNLNPIDDRQSPVTNIRVDANEFYAYMTYIDANTQELKTGIYDISTNACKQVGTVGAAGVPVNF